jgi:hypothetical protein
MTKAAMIVAALLCAGAAQAGEVVAYTLYRGSPLFPHLSQRVHIATFDAEERNAFQSKITNENNCASTQELFQAAANEQAAGRRPLHRSVVPRRLFDDQPKDVTHTFWCEPGRHRATQEAGP